MRVYKLLLIALSCLTLPFTALAQETKVPNAPVLSLKDALDSALQNNFNIKISRNSSAIASNNVTIGNAGILPLVTGNYTLSNSIQTTTQTRSDNTVNNIINANNRNNSYGVGLDWTIFDGFNMFATYDRLKELEKLGRVRTQDTVLQTVASVMTTYYDLVNQQKQIKALKGVIDISRKQIRYAQDRFEAGRVARLDVYNAQVALNTDTATLIGQQQQFKASKIELNRLLSRNAETEFNVADTILVDEKLKLGPIIEQAQVQNPTLLSASINRRLSDINLKQVRSSRYPLIGVSSGYQFNNSRNPAGFARLQNARGFTYGLNATINIFDGFNQWRRERNAKLQIANAQINIARTRNDVEAQISTLYSSYLSGLELIKAGRANVDIARKSLEISLEKYRLGAITPLEIREAQRNYLNATLIFYDAEFQSKAAEITLKQITGKMGIE